MALETATNISDLVATNPGINDPASRGDDHIRLIKQVLLNDLGSLDGALTVTAAQLNGMEAAYQEYTNTELADLAFGEGNAGTVGEGGLAGDYQAADAELQSQITANADNLNSLDSTLASFMSTYLGKVYPVGSIYANVSNAASPSSLMGFGSWQAMAPGRVLIGAGQASDGAETRSFTAQQADGRYRHQLTVAEMPRHRFRVTAYGDESGGASIHGSAEAEEAQPNYTDYQGGDQPHNNMQPYLVVYYWKRIA